MLNKWLISVDPDYYTIFNTHLVQFFLSSSFGWESEGAHFVNSKTITFYHFGFPFSHTFLPVSVRPSALLFFGSHKNTHSPHTPLSVPFKHIVIRFYYSHLCHNKKKYNITKEIEQKNQKSAPARHVDMIVSCFYKRIPRFNFFVTFFLFIRYAFRIQYTMLVLKN